MNGRHWIFEALAIVGLDLRNIRAQPLLPAITVAGFLAVVLVMVLVLSVGRGLGRTFSHTGSADVAMVVSSGAYSESESHLDEGMVRAVASQPGVAQTRHGPLVSPEFITSVSVPKQGTGVAAEVVMRGVTANAFAVHRQVRLIAGRRFRPGAHEAIVGLQAAREYQGLQPGDTIHSGSDSWTVVGLFAAGGGLRESEIWTDAAGLLTAFHMGNTYSDVYVRLASPAAIGAFRAAVNKDPRLDVSVQTEQQYFAQLAASYSRIVTIAGMSFAILMALGAMAGAANLMLTGLKARRREMATLRAMGFRRLPVCCALLLEAMVFSLIGGSGGCAIAYALFDGYQAGTTMGNGFSQIAFQFAVTPALMAGGIAFALIMGLIGGIFPAVRAARLPLAKALRQA